MIRNPHALALETVKEEQEQRDELVMIQEQRQMDIRH